MDRYPFSLTLKDDLCVLRTFSRDCKNAETRVKRALFLPVLRYSQSVHRYTMCAIHSINQRGEEASHPKPHGLRRLIEYLKKAHLMNKCNFSSFFQQIFTEYLLSQSKEGGYRTFFRGRSHWIYFFACKGLML